jgi:hypothetical protein
MLKNVIITKCQAFNQQKERGIKKNIPILYKSCNLVALLARSYKLFLTIPTFKIQTTNNQMNKFQKDLSLTFVKATILTIIVLGVMATISSCGDSMSAGRRTASNEYSGTVLKTGRHLTIRNTDSLSVLVGDTVSVFYMEGCGGQPSYYYIANTPEAACDTMVTEMYVDGKDTSYEKFEAWNVRLDRRVIR